MNNVDLDSFSAVELRAYASEELGMGFPTKITKAEMITRIREMEGSEAVGPVGAGAASDGNEGRDPIAVIINVQEDEDSRNLVPVNVNGRRYQVKKGTDVRVPYIVYDTLKNAVQGIPQQVKDEKGKMQVVMKNKQRFPFSVIQFIYE